jgi:hypothetical protein
MMRVRHAIAATVDTKVIARLEGHLPRITSIADDSGWRSILTMS